MKQNFRYENTYNSQYKQRISELVEYILDLEYGTIIEFSKCANILHYNIEDEKEKRKFRSTMCRVKNILIDYGYVLKSVTNIGYYILKPKQIGGYCYHTYMKRTENLLEKSSRILQHTETHRLSLDRKKEYNEVCDLNADLIGAIDNTIESSSYYANKDYYDSLED